MVTKAFMFSSSPMTDKIIQIEKLIKPTNGAMNKNQPIIFSQDIFF